MNTFIISFLAVIIISLCFTKKRFWEYRYIILTIGAGVALIATLTVNYTMRGKLPTKVETITQYDMSTFYIQDSLDYYIYCSDSVPNINIIKNFDIYDVDKEDLALDKNNKHQIPVKFILSEKSGDIKLEFIYDDSRYDFNIDDIYIEKSENDSTIYYTTRKLVYNIDNNWVTDLSMPRISTIKVVYLPPTQYAMIPDSLIRSAPY